MLKGLFTYGERKEFKLTEDLNFRIHCANPVEHASVEVRPRSWGWPSKKKGGTGDLIEELA